MRYICRKLEEKILNYAKNKEKHSNVLLISGARQVGKSTVLKHLFKENSHLHINFAREAGFVEHLDATNHIDEFKFLLESRFAFKIGHDDQMLIIDEGQLSTKLGGYVRFIKEEWENQKVIITGSTLSDLFKNHPNPTGRVSELIMRPFDFAEFLDATNNPTILDLISSDKRISSFMHWEIINLLQTYLQVGGLPDVISNYLVDKKENTQKYIDTLNNIYAFYKRDFSRYSKAKSDIFFDNIYQKIAAVIGSNIKFSTIIPTDKTDYKKLPEAISILESWHQILKINIDLSKLSKTMTVTPKRYIFDHGIRTLQHLTRFMGLNLADPLDAKRSDLGGIIENFVLTELLAIGNFQIKAWKKTHQSNEIDFVFSYKGKDFACEVKSALKNNRNHCGNLIDYKKDNPNAHLLLLNIAEENILEFEGGIKIQTLPIYKIQHYLTAHF